MSESVRVLVLLIPLLYGCETAIEAPAQTPVEAEAPVTLSETERLNAWFEARFDEELAFSPLRKTRLGIRDADYGKIDDMSESADEAWLAWLLAATEELIATFERDKLTDDAKVSYDLWGYRTDRAVASRPFRRHRYVFDQMSPVNGRLATTLLNYHRVDTPAEMEAYVSRIGEGGRAIEQLIARSRLAADLGIRPPHFSYDFVIATSRDLISGRPFDASGPDNSVWADAVGKVDSLVEAGAIDTERAQALRDSTREALLGPWKDANEALIDWQTEDRSHAKQPALGAIALPDGLAYYDNQLAGVTTTDLSAEDIHAIGLAEVDRLHAEMELVVAEIGFDGSLTEYFEHVRAGTDPRFFYANTDAARTEFLEASAAMIDNIRERLPDYFGLRPKAGIVVKRVEPFREQDGAAAHYFAGTPDGSRPGIYYAHLSDMTAVSRLRMESVAYHEGIPGHHMQVSIARELEDIPRFRRFGGYTAFSEGWGLYAEGLAKEMPGTYRDPHSEFGRLSSELWRAIRLVVDTGVHAQRWDEQRAVDYALASSPVAETKVRSEIQRYIVWPGQATGYMIGNLKIRELRQRASDALGADFDLRAYHDLVLGSGALPLMMLEARVDAWIDQNR